MINVFELDGKTDSMNTSLDNLLANHFSEHVKTANELLVKAEDVLSAYELSRGSLKLTYGKEVDEHTIILGSYHSILMRWHSIITFLGKSTNRLNDPVVKQARTQLSDWQEKILNFDKRYHDASEYDTVGVIDRASQFDKEYKNGMENLSEKLEELSKLS